MANAERKSYAQYCTVANALDIVGDRWTLLILRELLGGAARFSDLQDALPGIAKNLLTKRLRQLEDDGIIRRAGTQKRAPYTITELGSKVRPVIDALGQWGAYVPRITPPEHYRSIRATSIAFQAIMARIGAVPEEARVVELEIDGEDMQIRLDARPTASAGSVAGPDARLSMSRETVVNYLAGKGLSHEDVILVEGDADAKTAFLRALGK